MSVCSLTDSLGRIRQSLTDVLDPLIPRRSRCALVDFPAHPNVGDSAIWLGERAYLRDRGVVVAYTCDIKNYSKPQLDRLIGDGSILIHGGGNFGDLWPHHHALRLQVIRDFPTRRVIQLPQTVHFQGQRGLEDSKRVIGAHANFQMIARDSASLETFAKHFPHPCYLAPDSALYLGPQDALGPPSSEFFWLKRSDKESLGRTSEELVRGIPTEDWLQDSGGVRRMVKMFSDAKKRSIPVTRIERGLYDVFARARLRRGYRMLRQGRVVITERLHGHILCLLAGIPNVLIDNSYGKNATFYETWTRDVPGTRFVSRPAEARAKAQELLSESEA
jgi:exopolysaccharide biosynthesis predicted pyruvyltransferase EpsI